MLQVYQFNIFFLKFKSRLLVKRFYFFKNAAIDMVILALISCND